MKLRAAQARVEQRNWLPMSSESDRDSLDFALDNGVDFWVAPSDPESDPRRIIGVIGVDEVDPGALLALDSPISAAIQPYGTMQLKFLRVDPDFRGQGIGRLLVERVLRWCEVQEKGSIILNTSSPQHTARRLYESMGFREIDCTYLGEFELVWYKLRL